MARVAAPGLNHHHDAADPDRHRHRRHVHRRGRVRRGHRRAGHHQDARPPRPTRPTASWPASRRCSACSAPAATRSRAVSHGTTVATNQLLEGKVDRLGFVTTAGYEAMLEIARQSVPDGYGNSYFWVKPDRIVPRDLVRGRRRPARLHRRRGAARSTRTAPAQVGALVPRPRHQHPRRLLPARLRQPRPRGADARDPRRGAPRRGGVDQQRGAARVPRVRARDDHPGRRRGQAAALGATSPTSRPRLDGVRRPRRSRST